MSTVRRALHAIASVFREIDHGFGAFFKRGDDQRNDRSMNSKETR